MAGRTKSFDHCALINALWKYFIELNLGVWVERVASKHNIADNPSRRGAISTLPASHIAQHVTNNCRRSYQIFRLMGNKAQRHDATLASVFWDPAAWGNYSIREVCSLKRKAQTVPLL